MKPKQNAKKVTVSVRENALQSIFDECDRYDHDETGGRILGVCSYKNDGSLHIDVSAVIEPGPRARRSSSSFFQDGNYQAQVFRQLEAVHPEIEHLGNWHTHHVNGYPTLSGGDIATYQRIVNHEKHHLDSFYALLVVAREPKRHELERYRIRHYILFRGDKYVYEIDPADVVITKEPALWPVEQEAGTSAVQSSHDVAVRAKDKEIIGELFPNLRPYFSKRINTFYWKGPVQLIDDTTVQVTVPEITDGASHEPAYYQVTAKNVPTPCTEVAGQLAEQQFLSATLAVRELERQLNQTLYLAIKPHGSKRRWKF